MGVSIIATATTRSGFFTHTAKKEFGARVRGGELTTLCKPVTSSWIIGEGQNGEGRKMTKGGRAIILPTTNSWIRH